MLVVLLGYMGSGKSLIGRDLAEKLNYSFIDLDELIEASEMKSISEIFESNGELYFRRLERKLLEDILESGKKSVVSLGGGTPCYFNNMEMINETQNSITIYLNVNIKVLTKRLFKEKDKRPMISHLKTHEQLLEFIGKHMFERKDFYEKANHNIDVSDLKVNEITEQIIFRLFQDSP